MGLNLIGQYPLSNSESYRYVFVIVDYFSKLVDFVSLGNASDKPIADVFFGKLCF